MFVIGPLTNRSHTHAIAPSHEPCGVRISLTLRRVVTFRDEDCGEVSGKGAGHQCLGWPYWDRHTRAPPTVVYARGAPIPGAFCSHHRVGGSVFRCSVFPCRGRDELSRLRDLMRQRHPDACHIPCAWVVRPAVTAPRAWPVQGWINDGEPEGPGCGADTARDGLLRPLVRAGFVGCAALVARSWDGRRLGLGPLRRAYSAAVRLALAGPPSPPCDAPLWFSLPPPLPDPIAACLGCGGGPCGSWCGACKRFMCISCRGDLAAFRCVSCAVGA